MSTLMMGKKQKGKPAVEKPAGIASPTTFHGLRRGYITRLIRAGVDADLVRRLARHRDLKTTMAHYASAELSDLAAAAESLKPLKRPRGKP